MGDAANGGPPPTSSGASSVTYQANIATVHVKPEGDTSDTGDQRTISPATRRKQKNGILKKKAAPRNPTGTEAPTLTLPRPETKVSDSIVPIAIDAIKLDTVNNNDADLEASHQNVVAAPPVAPPSREVSLRANGAVSLAESFDKKVSWSAETVVYTSRDEEGGQHARPANGRPPGLTEDEQRLAQRVSNQRQKAASEKATNKCCVAIAVKLMILAIIGIVVLGIMYALRFSGSKTENDVATIRTTLKLRTPGELDLFTGAWHSTGQEPVLYLVADLDLMPWQRPTTDVNFLWHRGASLIVYSINQKGELRSSLLGDPLDNEATTYSLLLPPDHWHAARLFDKDSYAVFSVMAEGGAYNWTQANYVTLQRQYPTLVSRINSYARRT